MGEVSRRTLSVLVDNRAGVLSLVSRLFSRKGFNIESLSVGTTEDESISRMTIEIVASEPQVKLLSNQLRKLIPVHSVKTLTPEHAIRRELVLVKVSAPDSAVRSEVMQIAQVFRVSIIDISVNSLTLAFVGDENKFDGLQPLMEQYGILELVRTGITALERGQYTINENTKEKGEFDYGKHVL